MLFKPNSRSRAGQDIKLALAQPPSIKCPVVDELLYRRKVTLLAADPGSGKSTLALQIALAVSSGKPAFGVLDVPEALKVYIVPFETDWDEFTLALHRARGTVDFNPDNLIFDDGLLGVDVGSPFGADHIIDRIAQEKPGLVVIDPLYLLVAGDLSDGAVASRAMKWLLRLAQKGNCAVLVLHHTHREKFSMNGKPVKEKDASYGSRWIQANVVIQYNIKNEAGGTKWSLTKDRYKLSRAEIILQYDPETGLSTALKSKTLIKDELFEFIKWHKPGAEFTYPGLAQQFSCAEGYLSHLMLLPAFRKLIRKDAPPGKQVKLVRLYCEELDRQRPESPRPLTPAEQEAEVLA